MNAPVTLTCHYVWPFSITTTDTIGTEAMIAETEKEMANGL
jgi:hypothetical protein